MNAILEQINSGGKAFVDFAGPMLIQSSVLIIILLAADFLLRRKVRAVFRYCIWMLVFVKLVLPSSLSTPVSFGQLFGDKLANIKASESAVADNQIRSAEWPREFTEVEVNRPRPQRRKVSRGGLGSKTPDIKSEAKYPWQGLVFLGWLVGVLVLSALLIQRVWFVNRLLAQATDAGRELLDLLDRCRADVGAKRKVRLKLSANMVSPAVCGLFRPTILLPGYLVQKVSEPKLRTILIHELAHIKRADVWVNLMQTVLQIAYFYNPFVWLANAMVRRVREQAVDEMVLVTLRAEAKSYSNTLIDIGEMAFWRPNLSLRLVGVVESKKALQRRIKHMLNRPIPKTAKVGVVGVLAVIIIGAVLLPMARARNSRQRLADSGQKTTEKSEFAVTLANGVTVELVGVCEYPSEGKQWWQPDGSALEKAPYDSTKDKNIVNQSPENDQLIEFAIKVTGLKPQGSNIATRVPGATRTATGGGITGGESYSVSSVVCALPILLESHEVHVGIASAPWETIATQEAGFEKKATQSSDMGRIIWEPPAESGGKTTIRLARSFRLDDYNTRLIVEDKSGKTYKAFGSNTSNLMGRYTFGISLSQISKLHFQTRPYEWVEFKNVSLKAGVKTDVKVEVGRSAEAESSPSLSSAHSLFLFFGSLLDGIEDTLRDGDLKISQKLSQQANKILSRLDQTSRGTEAQLYTETIAGQFELFLEALEAASVEKTEEQLETAMVYLDIVEDTYDDLEDIFEKSQSLSDATKAAEIRKDLEQASALKIVVYEGGSPEPEVTLTIPLASLKMVNSLLPPKVKEQMLVQGIDLGEILKQVDNGLEPATLLEVKDGQDHVIISLE